MKKLLWALGLLLLVLGLVACGDAGDDAGGGHEGHNGTSADEDHSVGADGEVPGEVAQASDADTEVLVVASDELKFDPTAIEVKAGEVVKFIVRNEGKTDHEFVLGDEAYQEAHDKEMAGGGHDMGSMENAVTVAPGETAELTWRFPESGTVLYGCHEPGHYDGGMVGTIEVG